MTRLGDLLSEEPEDVSFVYEDTLPAGGMSILVAKPKVGKSTFGRNLALAVSRGDEFLGRKTAQGPVVYLALEEKRAQVQDHFGRMGAVDEAIYIHVGTAPEDAFQELEKAIDQYRPTLVIIDPLLKFVRIKDLNDYAEVTRVLEPLLSLARISGCHILCVHHSGKMDREGGDGILGSTALFGGVDTALIMRRKNAGRTVESIQRYGIDIPETVVGLDQATGLVSGAGSVADVELDRAKEGIKAAIKDGSMTRKMVLEAVEGTTKYIVAALKELVTETGQRVWKETDYTRIFQIRGSA